MKKISLHTAAAVTVGLFALHSYAGDDSKKEVVPQEPPAVNRWSISTGATVSSIKTSFRADPQLLGIADTGGNYTGGAPVTYLNGVVGASGPSAGSTTSATGGTPGTITGVAVVDFLTFNGATFAPGSNSDTELSVGPYVKLAYDAFDTASNTVHLSPFFQYTFTTAFDSANLPAQETDSTTVYRSNAAFNTVTYPGVQTTFAPMLVNGGAGSMNIYMHTFTLGIDFTKDLGSRVHLVISTGPTLNLFDNGFTAVVPGIAVARTTDLKPAFGWVGQLGVQVDLDSQKLWFIEASANYHWVTPVGATTPLIDARVEASSWGAELGVGRRF